MVWYRKFYIASCYIAVRMLPRFWQIWQNWVVSLFLFLIWGERRRDVQNNLSVIIRRSEKDPAVRQLARHTFKNYGLYLIDYVQINRLTKRMLPEEQEGAHYMQQALDEGRGAILITPHLGNWELGGVTFARRGYPIYALTLMDSENNVQDFRDQMRSTLGVKTVHIDPTRYATMLKLVNLLKENQVIAMLGDRWEAGRKVEVTFFGRQVVFPAGASALALTSGAPIIPAFTIAQPNGRYMAWMESPIRVDRQPGQSTTELIAEKTQEIARVFETVIARYPDQWYHFFDYFKRYGC